MYIIINGLMVLIFILTYASHSSSNSAYLVELKFWAPCSPSPFIIV